MSISGALLVKSIGGIAVAGLAALGGYNFTTTGCVLGLGCDTGVSEASVLPVAGAGDSCCSLGEAAGEVTLVAETAKAETCCRGEEFAEACCGGGGACCADACTEEKAQPAASVQTVALEEAPASCCSLGEAAAEVTPVAEKTGTDACCTEKAAEAASCCTEKAGG